MPILLGVVTGKVLAHGADYRCNRYSVSRRAAGGGGFRSVDTPGMNAHRSQMLEEQTDASIVAFDPQLGVDAPFA